MANDAKTFMIEDCQLIFRNFEGKEGQYNRKGDRNFAVILPQDVAHQMLKDGWNVRYLKENSGWVKIERLDGLQGWIPKDKVEQI